VTFVVLALASLLVYRHEVRHKRQLIRSHTADVCHQASRRVEVMIEGGLAGASIFARRWASHRDRDYSRERFVEFAGVMLSEAPGYASVRLLEPDGQTKYVVASGQARDWDDALRAEPQLLESASSSRAAVLSQPVASNGGVVFAVFPLASEEAHLGWIVVEFNVAAMVEDGFHDNIRAEFSFEVLDGDRVLYRYPPDGAWAGAPESMLAVRSFQVRNRRWSFAALPRASTAAIGGWSGSLPILFLGLALSVGFAALTRALVRHMTQIRSSRDRALTEISERMKAQEALRRSEARYRGVFESSTDGLLVIGADDRIVEANPAACEMHGREPGELDGRPFVELIAPSHAYLFRVFKERPDASGVFSANSVHVRADGTGRDVEVRVARFSDAQARRSLVILNDVTERNRAVQRLAMLSREVLMAQEDERARVSRDLHDELGQLLTASRIELGWLQKKVANMPADAAVALGNAVELVEWSADELRRICKGLRPPLLDDLGLEPAVRLLVREFEDRTGVRIDVELDLEERAGSVPKDVALCTYRILQESLNNASRHAAAHNIDITLSCTDASLVLSVYDDGRGFELGELGATQGCGIAGMHERAGLVSGHVEIRSARSQGTRVVFRVPLETPERGDVA
jgi:PAS domain S-box-containing protein